MCRDSRKVRRALCWSRWVCAGSARLFKCWYRQRESLALGVLPNVEPQPEGGSRSGGM